MFQRLFVVGLVFLARVAGGAEMARPAAEPGPLGVDLGLDNFAGHDSIAAALRGAVPDRHAEAPPPFDIAVRGPSGRDTVGSPLAAEVRGRLDTFDVAAGMLAAQNALHDGPTTWTGRIALTQDRPLGREAFELRTTLGRRDAAGLVGVEAGPRIERLLGHGTTFFIDGKAQAQAQRGSDTAGWSLRNLSPDGGAMVGVSATTGLAR